MYIYSIGNNTKTITCIDCGEEVEVDAKANNRNRCDECIEKARLDKYRRYNEKRKLGK